MMLARSVLPAEALLVSRALRSELATYAYKSLSTSSPATAASQCCSSASATPAADSAAEQPPVETRMAWTPPGSTPTMPPPAAATQHTQTSSDAAGAPGSEATHASVSQLHPVMQEVVLTLRAMGLQPGVECVVGDGLAVVDVGLIVQGAQIALELEEEAQAGGPGAGASPAASARAFALKRVRERALAAHGWTIVPIPESVWRTLGMDAGGAGGVEKSAAAGAASPVQHARIHYLLAQLKGTLAQLQKAKEHDHQHHGCCGGGCSH